jgi:hypothetical protein
MNAVVLIKQAGEALAAEFVEVQLRVRDYRRRARLSNPCSSLQETALDGHYNDYQSDRLA